MIAFVSSIAMVAGLYRDAIEPLLPGYEPPTDELRTKLAITEIRPTLEHSLRSITIYPEIPPNAAVLANRISDNADQYDLALRELTRGHTEAADMILQDAERAKMGELAEIYATRARARVYSGRYSEAPQFFSQAASLVPGSPDLEFEYSIALVLAGRYSDARERLAVLRISLGRLQPSNANVLAQVLHLLAVCEYRLGHYRESTEILELAERALNAADLPDSSLDSSIQHAKCELLIFNGEIHKAYDLLQNLLVEQQLSLSPSASLITQTTMSLAAVAGELGDYNKAESLYNNALAQALNREPPSTHQIVNVYTGLGRMESVRGRYNKAKELLLRALRHQEEKLEAHHPALGSTLINLGGISDVVADYENAFNYFHRAQQVLSSSLEEEHPDRAKLSARVGLALIRRGKYKEAIAILPDAISRFSTATNPRHHHLASYLIYLASAHLSAGELEEATAALKKAEDIARSLPAASATKAYYLNALASVKATVGSSEEALAAYYAALDIYGEIYENGNEAWAGTLSNLGVALKNLGRYPEARPVFEKAIAMYEALFGPGHPYSATSLSNLGTIYENDSELEKAESYYRRAISIKEEALDPNHPGLRPPLGNLGLNLSKQGRHSEAVPFLQRSIGINEKIDPKHPDLGYPLLALAAVKRETGEYDEAKRLANRVIEIWRSAYSDHLLVAIATANLGDILSKQGDQAEADRLFREALDIFQKSGNGRHPYCGLTMVKIGRIYSDKGDYQLALRWYSEGTELAIAGFGTKQDRVRRALEEYVELLKAAGQELEADKIRSLFKSES